MRFVKKNKDENVVQSLISTDNPEKTYSKDVVRKYLKSVYKEQCAYCDCIPDYCSYFEVEHFYPKGVKNFDRYINVWQNLHYSCKKCNNIKLNKYKNILSPNYYKENPEDLNEEWKITSSNELSSLIWYEGHLLCSHDNIGKETIELFNLNNDSTSTNTRRASLVESRLRVFTAATSVLNLIYKDVRLLKSKDTTKEELEELLSDIEYNSGMLLKSMEDGHPYSPMVKDNFLIPVIQILEIVEKMLEDYLPPHP